MSRGSVSMPGSAVCMLNAGIARATRKPPATISDTSGRRMTRSITAPQTRDSRPARLRLPMKGTRPFSTRSPSFESTAGRTVSEPITATATTRIVPMAKPSNVAEPPKYMPAIAAITVKPEISTARPDVAAAACSAASSLRPAARSSRSRRR